MDINKSGENDLVGIIFIFSLPFFIKPFYLPIFQFQEPFKDPVFQYNIV